MEILLFLHNRETQVEFFKTLNEFVGFGPWDGHISETEHFTYKGNELSLIGEQIKVTLNQNKGKYSQWYEYVIVFQYPEVVHQRLRFEWIPRLLERFADYCNHYAVKVENGDKEGLCIFFQNTELGCIQKLVLYEDELNNPVQQKIWKLRTSDCNLVVTRIDSGYFNELFQGEIVDPTETRGLHIDNADEQLDVPYVGERFMIINKRVLGIFENLPQKFVEILPINHSNCAIIHILDSRDCLNKNESSIKMIESPNGKTWRYDRYTFYPLQLLDAYIFRISDTMDEIFVTGKFWKEFSQLSGCFCELVFENKESKLTLDLIQEQLDY